MNPEFVHLENDRNCGHCGFIGALARDIAPRCMNPKSPHNDTVVPSLQFSCEHFATPEEARANNPYRQQS